MADDDLVEVIIVDEIDDDDDTPQVTRAEVQMATDKAFNAIDDIHTVRFEKTVLGDAFHFMDRSKLPMHHEYKALFFRCLRAAMFIIQKEDVEEVKAVLEEKGLSWEHKMAFDFDYIAQRVRRRAPPPDILYNRMKTVYDF